ncbi:AEC family transporter [Lentibacillus sediminis]|uniref:AEC family transporter n=1 Tax=Lentibacillus sediminis TaxID=1940529 RepID=UPI000C1B9349|nr:AEC family transporter [Lentibacillus sediminis]
MSLFLQVILPIIAVFASGYILQRIRVSDVRTLSTVTIYILTPALVFINLSEADFDSSYMIIVVFMLVLFFIMVLFSKLLARIFKWSVSVESATILTSGFMNSGNYGLPVVLFTVGEAALPYAVFIMVVQSMMNNFFGVYYASRSTSGIKRALGNIMKMPATYAAVLAFMYQGFSWPPFPESIHSTLSMVGDAAIPVMMVMLGMQLASITSLKLNWQVVTSAVVLKMVASPVIAFIFVALIDVDPMVAAVLVIISAMPTAATTTMYAIEFDTEPDLVSGITLVGTLISVGTLTILLNIIS